MPLIRPLSFLNYLHLLSEYLALIRTSVFRIIRSIKYDDIVIDVPRLALTGCYETVPMCNSRRPIRRRGVRKLVWNALTPGSNQFIWSTLTKSREKQIESKISDVSSHSFSWQTKEVTTWATLAKLWTTGDLDDDWRLTTSFSMHHRNLLHIRLYTTCRPPPVCIGIRLINFSTMTGRYYS